MSLTAPLKANEPYPKIVAPMLTHMLPMNTTPSDPRGPSDDQGNFQQWYPQQRAQEGLYFHAPPQRPAQRNYKQQRQMQLCQGQRNFLADAVSENEHAHAHRYPPNYRFPYAPSALDVQANHAGAINWPDTPPPSFQMTARKPPPEPPIVPHHNDVILGRGGKSHLHPGNEQLRQMAFVFRKVYVTSSKKGKSQLSRDLIKQVHALNPPGRFIHRNETTKMWKVVCKEKAREKTSQCLRDAVGGKGHAAYMKPRTEEEDALLREQMKGFNAEAEQRSQQSQELVEDRSSVAAGAFHRHQPPLEAHSVQNGQATKRPTAEECSKINTQDFQRLQSPVECATLVHLQEIQNQQVPSKEQDNSGMLQAEPLLSGQERRFERGEELDEMSTDESLLAEDPDGDYFEPLPFQDLTQPEESADHAMMDETANEFVSEFG